MVTSDKYEYMNKEKIDKQFICTLCHAPFIDPVSTPCLHTFCRRCIIDRLVEYLSCSICNRRLSNNDLMEIPVFINNILNDFLVKCVACGQIDIKRSDFNNHINEICPKTVVPCSAADIRCPWTGHKKQLNLHISLCHYEHIRPVLAEIFAENNDLKEKNVQYETCIELLKKEHVRLNDQCTQDAVTIAQLNEEVNFLRKTICHRNKILEDKINSFSIRSWIDLRKFQVSDLDMSIIVQMAIIDRQCTELELQGNQITDCGVSILVQSLHDNTSIVKLNLSHNPITDVGVELLANLLLKNRTMIEKLYLSDTKITDQGVGYLAEMVKENTTLTSLGIFQNQLSDRGIQKLVNVLATYNTSLKRLYLQSNRLVTDASINDLIKMFKHNESLIALDLKECGLTPTGIKRLRQAADGKSFSLTC